MRGHRQWILFYIIGYLACHQSSGLYTLYTDRDAREGRLNIRRFNDIINGYMRELRVPGLSVAVSKNGQFLLKKAYGRASQEHLMTPWNLVRIGSISKTLTAAGILRLYQDGRLALNDTVFGPSGLLNEYEIPVSADSRVCNITVQHLLNHASGWDQQVIGDPLIHRNLPSMEAFHSSLIQHASQTQASQAANGSAHARRSRPPSQHDTIRFMLRQPLQHNPGTKYAFSNVGYLILGRVIETVSLFSSYESYMLSLLKKSRVYRMQLGKTLKDHASLSEVEYFPEYPSDRVSSVFNPDELVSPPYGGFHMETAQATFGWTASADELVEFLGALDGTPRQVPRILSNETFALMLQNSISSQADRQVWYGMGLAVQDGGKTYWHSGVLEGSTGMLSRDESGHTWAILLNCKLDTTDLPDLVRYAIKKSSVTDPTWTRINRTRHAARKTSLQDYADVISKDGSYFVKLMIPDYKFQRDLSLFSSKRYKLKWIDAYQEYGFTYFNAVWTVNDGTRWRAYIDLTYSKYRKRFSARTAQGYRLAFIESYVKRRRLRYAAIFIKDYWPEWMAYVGVTPSSHGMRFQRNLNDGYRLVIQSVTEYRGRLYVSAIYDKITMSHHIVRMGLSLQEYTEELNRQLSRGRILSYVQAYEWRGKLRFSGIWTPRTSVEWATGQQMSKYTLLNKLLEFGEENVSLACVTAYHDNDMLRFTALWR